MFSLSFYARRIAARRIAGSRRKVTALLLLRDQPAGRCHGLCHQCSVEGSVRIRAQSERIAQSKSPHGRLKRRACAISSAELSLFPAVAIVIWRERRRVLRNKIDTFCGRFFFSFGQRFFVMLLGNEHVERRNDKESEDRSDRHAADEHKTN